MLPRDNTKHEAQYTPPGPGRGAGVAAVPAPQVAVQPPDHQVRAAAPLQSAGADRHRYGDR